MRYSQTIIIGCTLLTCIFSSKNVRAQSLDSLSNQVKALYARQDFTQALVKAKEMSVIAKKEGKVTVIGDYLTWEATIYNSLKDFINSEASYLAAIKSYELDTADSLQNVADARNALGVMYVGLEKYDLAEKQYLIAAEIYRKKHGVLSEQYTSVNNNLIQLYNNAGELKKLITTYEEAVINKKNTAAGKDSTYATMSNTLGLLYQKNDEIDKALYYFKEAKVFWSQNPAMKSPVYLQALINIKGVYDGLVNVDSALAVTNEIKLVKAQTLGITTTSYALSLNDLAVYYLRLKNYDAAEKNYKASVATLKKSVGDDDLNYNIVLSNLASLYSSVNKPDSAIFTYEENRTNYKRNLPKTNLEYGNTLNAIAVVLLDNHKATQAISYLEEAIKVWETDTILVSKTEKFTENLYLAYNRTKQYSKLAELYLVKLKGLNILAKTEELAVLMNKLGVVYENLDKTDTAAYYYLGSIEAYKKIFGNNILKYKTVYSNLGILYSNADDFKNVIKCYEELLLALSQNKLELSRDYAYYANALAVAFHSEKQYQRAKEFYKIAMQANFKLGGELDKGYIQALSNLAVAESALDQIKEAERLDLSVIELSLKAFGDTSKAYIDALNTIGDLYYKIDSNVKALHYYIKAEEHSSKTTNWQLHVSSLKNLASANAAILKFDLAIEQYLTVLSTKALKGDTTNKEFISTINALASVYAQKADFKSAEKFYSKALILNKEGVGYSPGEYLFSINGMGNLRKNQGKYLESEQFYLKALAQSIKMYGDTSIKTSTSQNNLAILYDEMNLFDKALKYYTMSFNIVKKQLGTDNLEYATCISNLGFIANEMSDYKKCEAYYLEAAQIRSRKAPQSTKYAESLYNLGGNYNALGLYAKSESLLLQSLEIHKLIGGENSLNYAQGLIGLSNLYDKMGKYSKALEKIDGALRIMSELFGKKSLQYARALDVEGVILNSLSRYKDSEKSYLECLAIRKEILGEQHTNYGSTLMSIAELYRETGSYEKALPLYQITLSLYKKAFGSKNGRYATAMSNLGLLYTAMGKYNLAEPLYINAKDIWKATQGETSLDYALSLNNMASFYSDLGQYEKAMTYYRESATIRKNLLGEDHPEYAEVLSNMGNLYSTLGLQDEAEKLQLQALDITKKANGILSKSYAIRLNNLASIFIEKEDYAKSEIYYREAINVWLKLTGELNPEYATAVNNIGVLYSRSGQLDKAMGAYLKVKELRQKTLGEGHPDYAYIMDNLYRAYIKAGDLRNAEECLQKMGSITVNNLSSTFLVLSEKEKGLFLTSKVSLLEDFNSFLLLYPQASTQTRQTGFDLLLKLKSLTLSETKNVLDKLKSSKDTIVTNLYEKWLSEKSYLAKQYLLAKDQQDKELKKVEDRTENMEKELTRRSGDFQSGQMVAQLTYKDVCKKLGKDEVAIEFVSFKLYNKKWTDSVIYAAYLIKASDSVPQFIPLCEAKKLNKLFEVAGKTATTMVNSFYRGTKVTNTNKDVLSDSLYNLVWKPLEPYLAGVKKIDYSPAGKLYAIAFNALQDSNKKLLIDKYELQQYTSTRELVFEDKNQLMSSPKSIALFGDATFSLDSTILNASITAKNDIVNYSLPANRGSLNNTWSALPGTLKEVNEIESLFKINNLSSKIFVQSSASEQNFKALSAHSPQILHVATHGFFLPDPALDKNEKGKSKYGLTEDPLLRSGLVLAGGNYAWGGGQPLVGREDGILTAYEISQLDLGQTDLVVLSACETALGDVKGSEGVFGLQRSFKMAGVKNMIVSLWQVPDKETAELMTSFYSNLLTGKPMDEAFSIAQTAMRKKYDPFYWAAFVLIK